MSMDGNTSPPPRRDDLYHTSYRTKQLHGYQSNMKTSIAALLGILSSSAQAENVGFIML